MRSITELLWHPRKPSLLVSTGLDCSPSIRVFAWGITLAGQSASTDDIGPVTN
jgi:hypothetical protein